MDWDEVEAELAKSKKSKKEKKKKKDKKKRKSRGDYDPSPEYDDWMREAEPPMGGLKISFRVGGTSAKAIARVETDDIAAEADSPVFVEQGPSDDDPEYSGEIGIETDSDEDWLDAQEKGNTGDHGAVAKRRRRSGAKRSVRTPQQRTVPTQHSRTTRTSGRTLTPASPEPVVEVTVDTVARKREAANRRKIVADKQREEIKQATVHQLLRKQTSTRLRKDDSHKAKSTSTRRSGATSQDTTSDVVPPLRYIANREGVSLSLPPGVDYPIPKHPGDTSGTRTDGQPCCGDRVCAVASCTHRRRYVHARTLQPVCSLPCYQALTALAATTAQ